MPTRRCKFKIRKKAAANQDGKVGSKTFISFKKMSKIYRGAVKGCASVCTQIANVCTYVASVCTKIAIICKNVACVCNKNAIV
jgi:hypothetical protein